MTIALTIAALLAAAGGIISYLHSPSRQAGDAMSRDGSDPAERKFGSSPGGDRAQEGSREANQDGAEEELTYEEACAAIRRTWEKDQENAQRRAGLRQQGRLIEAPFERSRSREERIASIQNLILKFPDRPEVWDVERFARVLSVRKEDILTPEIQAKLDGLRQGMQRRWETELGALASPEPYAAKTSLSELFSKSVPSGSDLDRVRKLLDAFQSGDDQNRLEALTWILAKYGSSQDVERVASAVAGDNSVLRRAALDAIITAKGATAVVQFIVPRATSGMWPLNERIAYLDQLSTGLETWRAKARPAPSPYTEEQRREAEQVLAQARPGLDALKEASFSSHDPVERAQAASLLDLSRPEDRKTYLELLDGELSGLMPSQLVSSLNRSTARDDPWVKDQAFALEYHRDPGVRSNLVLLMEDWAWDGTSSEGQKARAALQRLFCNDADEGVKKAASEALERLAEEDRERAKERD